jgi:transcriptional regulator GlxA family with amidase domain
MKTMPWIFLVVTMLLQACHSGDDFPAYNYGSPNRKKLPEMTLFNHSKIMKQLLGEPPMKVNEIGILVYNGANTMEAIAPMVVFSELMSVKIHYIAIEKGIVHTTLLDIQSTKSLDDISQLDVLVIPGGDSAGLTSVFSNQKILKWIQNIDPITQITAGIGTGSFILGKAGLLQQKKVALPWYKAQENALQLKAVLDSSRYIHDGKYYSCVGQTAAIDMCLNLVGKIAGNPNLQGAMLDLEYNPQPPSNAGSAATTEAPVLAWSAKNSYTLDGISFLRDNKIDTIASVKKIGILVYPDFFTLDAIGPLVVLSQLNNVQVQLISCRDAELKTGRTKIKVKNNFFAAKDIDILVVPGGSEGTWKMTQDTTVLQWIKTIDHKTSYTTSVCTGSWILGAAGLLQNKSASTNWYRAGDMMKRYGATFNDERYTVDGKYWTSAGVSAGIDMSFALVEKLAGNAAMQQAMFNLAYYPQPPIEGGSPAKTDDLVLDMMVQMYDYIMVPLLKK